MPKLKKRKKMRKKKMMRTRTKMVREKKVKRAVMKMRRKKKRRKKRPNQWTIFQTSKSQCKMLKINSSCIMKTLDLSTIKLSWTHS